MHEEILSPRFSSYLVQFKIAVSCEVKTRKLDDLKSYKPLVLLTFSKSPIRILAPQKEATLLGGLFLGRERDSLYNAKVLTIIDLYFCMRCKGSCDFQTVADLAQFFHHVSTIVSVYGAVNLDIEIILPGMFL